MKKPAGKIAPGKSSKPPARAKPSAKRSDAARAAEASLAQLVREALSPRTLPEKKMFGGTCFLLNGNMLCGTYKGDVIFRVGPDAHAESLREKGAKPFIMQDKTLQGWIAVSGDVLATPVDAKRWIGRAMLHVGGLPAK